MIFIYMLQRNFSISLLPRRNHIYIVLLLITLVGCKSSWQQRIPKTDIVYQTWEAQKSALGFVNADGSNNTTIVTSRDFYRPVVSKDGNFIYGLSNKLFSVLLHPAYWDILNKRFYYCDPKIPGSQAEVISAEDSAHPELAIVNAYQSILLVDLKKCIIQKTLIDYDHNNGVNGIKGITFNSETKDLVYSLEIFTDYYQDSDGHNHYYVNYQIIKFNVNTQTPSQIAIGINPAYSPDGKRLSFTGLDGLYVMNEDGSQAQRIFNYKFVASKESMIDAQAPYMRWSPDGKWLVYNFCDHTYLEPRNICIPLPIYKILSTGGSPVKIVDDGDDPFWRP